MARGHVRANGRNGEIPSEGARAHLASSPRHRAAAQVESTRAPRQFHENDEKRDDAGCVCGVPSTHPALRSSCASVVSLSRSVAVPRQNPV